MKVSEYFEQKFFADFKDFKDFRDLRLVDEIAEKLKTCLKIFAIRCKVEIVGEEDLQGFLNKSRAKVAPGPEEVKRVKEELRRLRGSKAEFCADLEKCCLDFDMLENIVRFNQEYRRPIGVDLIQSIGFYRLQKEQFEARDKEVVEKLRDSREKIKGIIESVGCLKNSIKCCKFLLALAQEDSVQQVKSSFSKRSNNILRSNATIKKRILIETHEKNKINLINFEPRLQSPNEDYKIEIKRLQTLSSSPSPYSLQSCIEKSNKRATLKPRFNCLLPNSSQSPKPEIFNRPDADDLVKVNFKKDFDRVFLSPSGKRVTFSLSNERKNGNLGISQ